MARTSENENMTKTATSLTFNDDKPPDQELIGLANEYGRLPKNQGIPLTSVIRNLLLRTLKSEIEESKQTSGVTTG